MTCFYANNELMMLSQSSQNKSVYTYICHAFCEQILFWLGDATEEMLSCQDTQLFRLAKYIWWVIVNFHAQLPAWQTLIRIPLFDNKYEKSHLSATIRKQPEKTRVPKIMKLQICQYGSK